MAGPTYKPLSSTGQTDNESDDWPLDEPIISQFSPKLQVSSEMVRPAQVCSRHPAYGEEWPSDDELENHLIATQSYSSTTTEEEDTSVTRTDSSETTSISMDSSQDQAIDLTSDDGIPEDREVIDLTGMMDWIGEPFDTRPGSSLPGERPYGLHNAREGSVIEIREVDAAKHKDFRPSLSVQLADGSYLRIERVVHRGDEQFLYGRFLLKTTDDHVESFVPKVDGELIWMTNLTDLVPVRHVRGFKKIHFTNARSFRQSHPDLFCRLKMTERARSSLTTRRGERAFETECAVEYLTHDESDEGYRITATTLRDVWRGKTTPFGDAELPFARSSSNPTGHPATINLADTPPPFIDLTALDRTYTFGDAFCGAGGTSCGARQAGLEVRWGSDKDTYAVETYSYNFDAVVYQAYFDQLMALPDAELRVDICHCSPPCQPFSPAHTVNNLANDEQNSACIFAARNLLQRARPRILTMEETSGLDERHRMTLHRVILDLVEEGYSARWTILDCLHYGVPQSRKRLVIIAAGPGETLPNFPPETHGLPGGGLLPVATIHDAIHDLPESTSHHNVDKLLKAWSLAGHHTPYDPHGPARTITCNGGESNYHPSGLRRFTPREVACLQTFPLSFEFSHRNVRKQIGNAVPPKLAEAIYREISRSLRQTDEQEMRERELRTDHGSACGPRELGGAVSLKAFGVGDA